MTEQEIIIDRLDTIVSQQATIVEAEKSISFYEGQTSAIAYIIMFTIIIVLFFKMFWRALTAWM